MTVLYNSGFAHRDHHRLRDQLRDLRRNTCRTAALFRRLRASYGKPWLISLFRAAPVLYILAMVLAVSYTHLTLPTILLV